MAHLRGGSGLVALSGCVGHACYGIPVLDEGSASAPQVRMRREHKIKKTVHVSQEEQRGATVSDRVHATRAKRSTMSRGQNSAMIALRRSAVCR
eukprot:5107998-Pleurochrysis_carterae.AAC.1